MQEWIMRFSSFVASTTSSVLPVDAFERFYFQAIALTVFVLAIRIATERGHALLQKFFPAATFPGIRAKRQELVLSALKTCPKCAEQLPLSTLVCDTCDYNFLSRTVGHRHKLLPAPDVATSSG